MIVRIETDERIDDFMDLQDERIQKILKIMKIKNWAFVHYVPKRTDIHHDYCMLPVYEIPEVSSSKIKKIGAYIFNFSLVEEKSMMTESAFKDLTKRLSKVPEPQIAYIGPLPKDDATYRVLKINDTLSPMPPKSGSWI
ncbi:MAG: hypothetical protein K6G80_12115 [Treponema sp.]|nr:hypothetical protein [Treponema sp.]